jgi:hypothetical protein
MVSALQSSASTVLLLLLVGGLLANQVQMQSELGAHREEYRRMQEEHREEYRRMQEEHREVYAKMQEEQREQYTKMHAELESMREEIGVRGEADEEGDSAASRRLGGIYTIGTAAGSGCFEVTADATLDLSTTACTVRCPSCFVFTGTADSTLTISNAGTALWKSAAFSGIREYLFVNAATNKKLTITADSRSYILGPLTTTFATVKANSDSFMFQSNYGMAGANVAVCPDGCDSDNPMKSSDSLTAMALIPTLTTAQTQSVMYLGLQ